MQSKALAAIVTRIYTAAGRRPGDVEFEVWDEALRDIDAGIEEATACAVSIVRSVDVAQRFPSPAVIRDHILTARRRDGRLELPEIECDECEGSGWKFTASNVVEACKHEGATL